LLLVLSLDELAYMEVTQSGTGWSEAFTACLNGIHRRHIKANAVTAADSVLQRCTSSETPRSLSTTVDVDLTWCHCTATVESLDVITGPVHAVFCSPANRFN